MSAILLISLVTWPGLGSCTNDASHVDVSPCMDFVELLQVRTASIQGNNADIEGSNIGDASGQEANQEKAPDNTSGMNFETGYIYSFGSDCYGNGTGAGTPCPNGQWCQVSSRENWYPWDISYINRGRCLPYAKEFYACEPAMPGELAFPRKANGDFFDRPTLCDPELVCTGDDIHALPATCVKRRSTKKGCMSGFRLCAGRPGITSASCPGLGQDFCVCPITASLEGDVSDCLPTDRVTRTKLEQCGSIFNSFQGSNFAFAVGGGNGLPNDNNVEMGHSATVTKLKLQHGPNTDLANHLLKALWPFPVCDGSQSTSNCTQFPLPTTTRDPDGGLLGDLVYANGTTEKASFLHDDQGKQLPGDGILDYHCTWMMLHTLTFHGPPMLSVEQQTAAHDLIMYVSGQFDCKVCRSNFVEIVHKQGLPNGPLLQTYAHWMWQAHNNANEHSYATHSNIWLESKKVPGYMQEKRRWDQWGAPVYEQPWFITFEDAAKMWQQPLLNE